MDKTNDWFQKSLDLYHTNPEPILEYAKEHYNLNIDYLDYFKRLRYCFTESSFKALETFESHLATMDHPSKMTSHV